MKIQTKGFFLMLLGFIPLALSAQNIQSGIHFGMGTGSVKVENIDDQFTESIQGNGIKGFEGGVFVKLKLGPLFARPSLLYGFKKGDVTFRARGNENNPENETVLRQHRLQIPVMFGLNILGPLAIEAGPTYAYLLDVTEKYGENEIDLGRNGMGYRIGASLNLGRVYVNVNYEGMRFVGRDGNPVLREPYRLLFGVGLALGGGKD